MKLHWVKWLSIGICLTAPVGWAQELAYDPKVFWRHRDKTYSRIKEAREIIVLVKSKKNSKLNNENLKLFGAGHIDAPMDFSWSTAIDYSNLVKMTSYVHEAKFDSARSELYMHSSAFDYHARMTMKIRYAEAPTNGSVAKQIHFHIIKGVFTGMRGYMNFEDYGRRKTEISLAANYDFEKLSIPRFFVRFGLEVVLQKMAARMRAYTEELYEKSKLQGESK